MAAPHRAGEEAGAALSAGPPLPAGERVGVRGGATVVFGEDSRFPDPL